MDKTHDQYIMDVLEDDKNKIMKEKTYEANSDYIRDVLEDEEGRLMDKLIDALPEETRYLFFRYLAVKETIEEVKPK